MSLLQGKLGFASEQFFIIQNGAQLSYLRAQAGSPRRDSGKKLLRTRDQVAKEPQSNCPNASCKIACPRLQGYLLLWGNLPSLSSSLPRRGASISVALPLVFLVGVSIFFFFFRMLVAGCRLKLLRTSSAMYGSALIACWSYSGQCTEEHLSSAHRREMAVLQRL